MEEGKKEYFSENNLLEKPIQLNSDLCLQKEDIEDMVAHTDLPRETLLWKVKSGFPTYHLNPSTRLLVIYGENELLSFQLKEDSILLKKYMDKYGNRK